jgi:hypothetical protein
MNIYNILCNTLVYMLWLGRSWAHLVLSGAMAGSIWVDRSIISSTAMSISNDLIPPPPPLCLFLPTPRFTIFPLWDQFCSIAGRRHSGVGARGWELLLAALDSNTCLTSLNSFPLERFQALRAGGAAEICTGCVDLGKDLVLPLCVLLTRNASTLRELDVRFVSSRQWELLHHVFNSQ